MIGDQPTLNHDFPKKETLAQAGRFTRCWSSFLIIRSTLYVERLRMSPVPRQTMPEFILSGVTWLGAPHPSHRVTRERGHETGKTSSTPTSKHAQRSSPREGDQRAPRADFPHMPTEYLHQSGLFLLPSQFTTRRSMNHSVRRQVT